MILRSSSFLGAAAVAALLSTTQVSAVINTSTHPCFQDEKTLSDRSTPINMTEITSRRLTNIIELMGQDGQLPAALSAAIDLEARVRNSRYEHAITLQTLGYIYVQMERYADSIPVLRQSAEYDAMPDIAQQQTLWLLVNMYAAVEDWQSTVSWLDRWCTRQVTPTSAALILGAQARAQMGQHRDAIPFVRRAIERESEPKENWYQLWLAMHYELREYTQASGVLETMVSLWPTNRTYWNQLSGLYMELQDDTKSLATMALMYRNGMTTEESDILSLVRMYLFMDDPHSSATILDREIRAGRVEANEENLELLGNAWAQARENQEAVDALGRAAELSEDGEIFVRRAQILVQMQLWSDVIESVDAAVAKGGLEKPGNAYLLQGMAAAELKRFEEAVIYFNRAAAYPETRTQARDWARYMQEELAVSSG